MSVQRYFAVVQPDRVCIRHGDYSTVSSETVVVGDIEFGLSMRPAAFLDYITTGDATLIALRLFLLGTSDALRLIASEAVVEFDGPDSLFLWLTPRADETQDYISAQDLVYALYQSDSGALCFEVPSRPLTEFSNFRRLIDGVDDTPLR